MDGILVINKPKGLSSHDCVNVLRRQFKTKKVGHSGTLDVAASGVLVLGINKGTKLLNYLNQDDKEYHFDVCFGVLTDTLDHTGSVTAKKKVDTLQALDGVVKKMLGTYMQTPQDYSAVKVNGKKLYEYARNNEKVPEVKPRELTIYDLKRTSPIRYDDSCATVSFCVHGSKGLYVRQLALDLAKHFNTVAHTTRIHRTKAGDFKINDAVKLDDVTKDTPCLSLADALRSLPEHVASEKERVFVQHGRELEINYLGDRLKIIDNTGTLLAIYEYRHDRYKAKNVFS